MHFYNFNGLQVTTTDQLSDLLRVNKKAISRNFQRNKHRYTKGVHYFQLEGSMLTAFKKSIRNPEYLKYTSNLYLWTVPGIRLLAKSCRSGEAWELYEKDLNEVTS